MLTFGLLVATLFAPADIFEFRLGGSVIGTSEWIQKEDGTFTSTSNLDLVGTKVTSSLSGTIRSGLLVSYTLKESAGANSATITVQDGKGLAEQGPVKREFSFNPTRQVFANFHPGLGKLLGAAVKDGPEGKFNLTILDGAATISAEPSGYRTYTAKVKGATQTVSSFNLKLQTGLEIKFTIREDGGLALLEVPTQKFSCVAKGWEELLSDPTAADKRLSQPELETERLERVMAPMRDRVSLAADIVKPKPEGRYPAILIRTPYGRKASAAEGDFWASRGYVLVSQDVRGRGDSEGEFMPTYFERQDGYDTLEWITKQPWSNGKVGMIGASYLGWVQWYAAATGHPALKCIIPQVSPTDPFFNIPFDHGVPMLYGSIWWASLVKDRESNAVGLAGLKNTDALLKLPLTKVDDYAAGKSIPFFDRWWQANRWSDFGSANFLKDVPKIRIPILHISGIWDGDAMGTKKNWEAVAKAGKAQQWLIYGPWTHAFNTSSKLGDIDYGKDAILELDTVYLRFFDTYLKGREVDWKSQPRVRMFVTGANQWSNLSTWPAGSQKTLYLAADGDATGTRSRGRLSEKKGSEVSRSTMPYDPTKSVVPKELQNVENLLEVESNTKVDFDESKGEALVFQSAPLKQTMTMGAPIQLKVHFSSTAKDCDLFFWVLDTDSRGVSRVIGQPGKIRARYVHGFDDPKPLVPGKIYEATLDHWDVAHEFKKGHRISVMMTSGYFPMFARNNGTAEPVATATALVKSRQTIYHSARYPSQLTFRQLSAK